MHIAQTEVCLKYLSVYQTLHEYLFKTQSKSIAEESSLKSEFIRFRKIEEPYNTSRYNIDENEVQSNIKWYYERIKLHIHLIFEMPVLPELQHFLY